MESRTNRKPYKAPILRDLGRMSAVTKHTAKGDHGWDWADQAHTKKY